MERTQALENIKAILLKSEAIDQETADSLIEETVLYPDLIDSLDSVELCMEIEKQLNTVIPDNEFNKVFDKGGKMSHVIDLYLSHHASPKKTEKCYLVP